MENRSIIFLDNNKALLFDGKAIKSTNFKDTKKIFTATLLPIKYLNVSTFKFSKNLSDEELQIQVEIKMYEEAGLDPNKDHIIDYLKYDIDDEYIVEAFALSKDDFEKEFNTLSKNVEAIDLLFPRFLSYEALYIEELKNDKNDLFIYLDEDEAFGAIYKKGQYIGYRAIDSLSNISKKAGIEIAKLKEYLATKGLVRDNYSFEEMHIIDALQDIFLKNIERLIYSVNHKRSLFALEGIDRVYIDFGGKKIEGLKEFFISYGFEDIEIEALKCCSKDGEEIKLYLSCKYAFLIANGVDLLKINLSFLHRKKRFYEYLIFKYGAILSFFIVLALAIYGYIYYKNSLLEEEISLKNQKLNSLKKESKKYFKKIEELKKQKNGIEGEIKSIEHQIFVYENSLKMIPFIDKQKISREEFMNDVVYALAKYRLNTKFIKQKDSKEMEIMLISKTYERDKIAKFIKELLKKGYLEVKTDEIVYEDGIYTSLVKVKR